MNAAASKELKDGDQCKVIGGTHVGKSGTVQDMKTGKTGHVSITVMQADGVRFKTLARNVVKQSGRGYIELASYSIGFIWSFQNSDGVPPARSTQS